MKKQFILLNLLALLLFLNFFGNARDIYVSLNGNNAGGLTIANAFKTIQKAHDISIPGDNIYILSGIYIVEPNRELITITRSGSSGNPITYQAYNLNNKPVLKMKIQETGSGLGCAFQCIKMVGVHDVNIKGLRLEGANDQLDVQKGEAVYNWLVYRTDNHLSTGDATSINYLSTTNTNGISITRDAISPTNINYPNNIVIDGCIISNFSGGGIVSQYADYVTIQWNIIYDCAWYTCYAASGISVAQGVDPANTYKGYKTIVRNNIVYGNKTLVKWISTRNYSDGNGIIADLNHNVPNEGLQVVDDYDGKTLFQNNICYNNGGAGLSAVSANNVNFIGNTVYKNGTRPQNKGGAYANLAYGYDSQNNRVINNIVVAQGSPCFQANGSNPNSFTTNNIYFNGSSTYGTNDIYADPGFVGTFTNMNGYIANSFKITTNSPAFNNGLFGDWSDYPDWFGTTRPQGPMVDIGAVEISIAGSRIAAENLDEYENYVGNLFPNPTDSNLISIDIESKSDGICYVNSIDISGRKISLKEVQLNEGKNKVSLNVKNLPIGLNFIEFDYDNRIIVRKLIKF